MELTTGLRRRLARCAVRRPHVLLVAAPGGTGERLAAEAQLRAVGGVLASGPADADLLVVGGRPGVELAAAAERVWSQIPSPRVRVDLTDPLEVAARFEDALSTLRDVSEPLSAARDSGRSGDPSGSARPATRPGDRAERGGPDAQGEHDEHGAEEHGGHEHGSGHGGHGRHGGHGDMDMDLPGGLMMADRADDRDGLRLDVLHVPLGPVLPAWPAGLVVDTALQGDVVQSARWRLLAGAGATPLFWTSDGHSAGALRAAAHLDSLTRLLAVCGWDGAASEAGMLRDEMLGGEVPRARFDRFRRRVGRSRNLRAATAGLGRLDAGDVDRLGLSGPAARAALAGRGDATGRYRIWLAEVDDALAGHPVAPAEGPRGEPGPGSAALVAAAVELMVGLDLAAARVVLASLDPDPDELAAVHATRRDVIRGAS